MRMCVYLLGLCVLLAGTLYARAEDLKIGVIYPLSGHAAYLGESNKIGAEIATELINEAGGINGKKLELKVEDSQSEARLGVSAFMKLTDTDRPQVFVSALSSVGMALRPLVEKEQVLLFADSAHPNLVRGYNFVVRNFFSVVDGNNLVLSLMSTKKYLRLAVLQAEEEYAEAAYQALTQRIRNLPQKIVAHETFAKNSGDLRAQLIRIKNKQPDIIYVMALGPTLGVILRQKQELGIKSSMIALLLCGQRDVFEQAKPFAEGAYSVETVFDTQSESFRKLSKRYESKYPKRPLDYKVVFGFDAVTIIAEALQHVPYSAKEIRNYIVSKQFFNGASGKIEFSLDGDSWRPLELQQVQAGACTQNP